MDEVSRGVEPWRRSRRRVGRALLAVLVTGAVVLVATAIVPMVGVVVAAAFWLVLAAWTAVVMAPAGRCAAPHLRRGLSAGRTGLVWALAHLDPAADVRLRRWAARWQVMGARFGLVRRRVRPAWSIPKAVRARLAPLGVEPGAAGSSGHADCQG